MKDQITEQGSHTSRFCCTWNEYMWTSPFNSQQTQGELMATKKVLRSISVLKTMAYSPFNHSIWLLAQQDFNEYSLPHKTKMNIPHARNSFYSSNLHRLAASLENTVLDWLPSWTAANSLSECLPRREPCCQ